MKLIAEFEIKGLPKTVNDIGRKHWAYKHKEASKWKNWVHLECARLHIAGLNLTTAQLELTRFSSHECDFDNLASSFKHVIDGLKQACVITDDKPSVIGSPTFIWEKTKPGQGRIRVRVFADRSGNEDKA